MCVHSLSQSAYHSHSLSLLPRWEIHHDHSLLLGGKTPLFPRLILLNYDRIPVPTRQNLNSEEEPNLLSSSSASPLQSILIYTLSFVSSLLHKINRHSHPNNAIRTLEYSTHVLFLKLNVIDQYGYRICKLLVLKVQYNFYNLNS